jgi:hypothetical protein
VEAISPSFADELFAKLPGRAFEDGHITVENVADHLAPILEFFTAPHERAS